MVSNYKNNGFRGEHLVNLAWVAAKGFKKTDHEKIMEMLKNENVKAKEYLEKEPVQSWARCFFDTTSWYFHHQSKKLQAGPRFKRGEDEESVKGKGKMICSKWKGTCHNKITCDARNDPTKVYKRKLKKYKRNEMIGIAEDHVAATSSRGRGKGRGA
ncbi:hypothetical protein FRX31_015529, partial [Thalictrum thalictroides]